MRARVCMSGLLVLRHLSIEGVKALGEKEGKAGVGGVLGSGGVLLLTGALRKQAGVLAVLVGLGTAAASRRQDTALQPGMRQSFLRCHSRLRIPVETSCIYLTFQEVQKVAISASQHVTESPGGWISLLSSLVGHYLGCIRRTEEDLFPGGLVEDVFGRDATNLHNAQ